MRVRSRACLRVRETAAGGECGKGARLSAETREEKHKTRLESRKNPLVFAVRSFLSKKIDIFLLEIAIIRNVSFIFALDKTQLSFFFSRVVASI